MFCSVCSAWSDEPAAYFRDVLIGTNFLLRVTLRLSLITTKITIEMLPAIRPYSIAVAPDWPPHHAGLKEVASEHLNRNVVFRSNLIQIDLAFFGSCSLLRAVARSIRGGGQPSTWPRKIIWQDAIWACWGSLEENSRHTER
jgi:hypothetical protein